VSLALLDTNVASFIFSGDARATLYDGISTGTLHFIVIGERHLRWIFGGFVAHYNAQRPHQGAEQRVPAEIENRIKRPPAGESCDATF
jgi:hypothetical protein